MLKITKKFEYGLIAIRHMALMSEGSVATAKEISQKANISYDLLAKILQRLAKSDIIMSVQGVKGGYRLAKDPSEITLSEIAESIEGPINLTDCQEHETEDTECNCDIYASCAIKRPLNKIKNRFKKIFDESTVEEII